MNILQVLLIFFLANYAYIRSTTLSRKMSRGVLNYLRRNRKIGVNDHLIPPPAQLLQPPARTGRQYQTGMTIPISTETPRYLTNPIGWFNSLGSSSVSHVPRAPYDFSTDPYLGTFPNPPLPLPFASSMQFRDKKYLPFASSNAHNNVAPVLKRENCNPCNKIPWTPVGYNFFHLRKDSSDDLHGEFSSTPAGYLSHQEKFFSNLPHVDSQEARDSNFSDFIPGDPNFYPIDPYYKRGPADSPSKTITQDPRAHFQQAEIKFNHQYGNPTANVQTLNYGDLTTSDSVANPNRVSVALPGHEMSFNEGIHEKRPVSRTTLNSGDSVSEISNKEEYYRPPIEKLTFGSSSNYSGTSYLNSFAKSAEPNPLKEDFADTVASHSSIEPLNEIHHQSSTLQDLNTSENISSFNSSSTAILPAYESNYQQYVKNIGLNDDSRTASQSGISHISYSGDENSAHLKKLPLADLRQSDERQNIDTRALSSTSHRQTASNNPSSTNFTESQLELSSKKLSNFLYDSVPSRSNGNIEKLGKGTKVIATDDNGRSQREQSTKHSTQVQVIIPYTSDFSPIPFRQTQWNWKFEKNLKSVTPTPHASHLIETKHGDQYGEGSNSASRVLALSELDILRTQLLRNKTDLRVVNIPPKWNSSIDLKRLQKNIDNWTIQEYSRTTTSSTLLPSSMRFYLLPSKKIPNEYLTKTEAMDSTGSANTATEDIEKYLLNVSDVAAVGYKEWRVNQTEINKLQEIDVNPTYPILTSDTEVTVNTSASEVSTSDMTTRRGFGASIAPLNKEHAYVVTPPTILITTSAADTEEKESVEGNSTNSQRSHEINGLSNEKNYSKFDPIERIYQVLPQAVNNLALASTGKEGLPLWGIMEHEEFASLNFRDQDTSAVAVDGPILHTGHSKVSRFK